MDFIRPLACLLDPMAGQASIVLDAVVPLDAASDKTHGRLEWHAVLTDGRMVLFAVYQHAALRTITAEMWV